MIKLLIFDLDGTLIDTRQDIASSVNYVLKNYDLPPKSLQEVTDAVGFGIERLIARCILDSYPELEVKRIKILKQFRTHYREHCTDTSIHYPGVIDFLEKHKDKHLAILSNKPEAFCRVILEKLKCIHYFPLVVGGDSFRNKKPLTEGMEHILNETGAEVEEAVMIGDSAADIETAQNMNMTSIGILDGMGLTEPLKDSKPSYLVNSFKDIENLEILSL
ncbi:MAG: HAD-IA family hydrolase [Fibrobacteria bacterium]|nr:HAD-IA family hydrolase [Fibrobacteria bacterium]